MGFTVRAWLSAYSITFVYFRMPKRRRKPSPISKRRGAGILFVIAFVLSVRLVYFKFATSHNATDTGQHYGPNPESGSEHVSELLVSLPTNVLIVEPFHGLGNRLRAYASAVALASRSRRPLAVVWIPDVHVDANLRDLIEVDPAHIVFDFPILPSLRGMNFNLIEYDYNRVGGKDRVLRDHSRSAIYVRSAYVLQSQTKVTEADIEQVLQSLKPVANISRRVAQASSALAKYENIVGVHIRMVTNLEDDVPGISQLPEDDSAGINAMGPAKRMRSNCHYTKFVPHLDREIRNDEDVSFLVASDTAEAVSALRQIYGERILKLNGTKELCYGVSRRGLSCLQGALADFIVLSQVSSALILSDWSSASELILRFAGRSIPHRGGCMV